MFIVDFCVVFLSALSFLVNFCVCQTLIKSTIYSDVNEARTLEAEAEAEAGTLEAEAEAEAKTVEAEAEAEAGYFGLEAEAGFEAGLSHKSKKKNCDSC